MTSAASTSQELSSKLNLGKASREKLRMSKMLNGSDYKYSTRLESLSTHFSMLKMCICKVIYNPCTKLNPQKSRLKNKDFQGLLQ